jgi:1-acyl-sn-glycerol-3-phosphate acyltransferase
MPREIFKEPEEYKQRPAVRKPVAAILKGLNRSGLLTRKLQVVGLENISDLAGSAIIAPNHRSMADTVLDGLVANEASDREVFFAGKQELWKLRPLGWLFESLGSFPVRRTGGGLEHFTRVSSYMLQHGAQVIVYPQGTRKITDVIDDTKKGAALLAVKNRVPIVPVGQYGTEDLYDPRKRDPVTVVVGEPIEPDFGIVEEVLANGQSEVRAANNAARELDGRLQVAMQASLDEAIVLYDRLRSTS